ncbi:MAG: phosphoribosylamine--glycine ligase, partial [Lentisphaeria bacterium]
MKVLVVGGGGREHALAWKLAQSPMATKVYAAPGNPLWDGVESVNITDLNELANFAVENEIGFTMVGPEVPLCDGIVNIFRARGLKIFGPNQEAAQLEGSKAFAKEFMFRHGIPTAFSKTFTDAPSAINYITEKGAPIVIKADGLAAGKGVIVAETLEQAIDAVKICFTGAFGTAGERVVIEEFLPGEEASILAFVDGKTIKPLASAQDHKRRFEGDTGPNTGGMGAYSPAPVVDEAMWQRIEERILKPFLNGVQADNLDFRGIIFIGIMISPLGVPRVLEFNVRFGDPETEAILPRMTNDLLDAMLKTVDYRLNEVEFTWSNQHAVSVVLASGGYPDSYEKGKIIS